MRIKGVKFVRFALNFLNTKRLCQVTKSPRLYVLFRTAVPGITPVTRLPFAEVCAVAVVRS